MSDGLQLSLAFAIALIATLALVPLVRLVALRTRFVDVPGGYKAHSRVTPYLGGAAVVTAVGLALLVSGAVTSRYAALFVWAFVLFVVGTVDDKRNLNPGIRMAIEATAGAALWNYGLGWNVFDSEVLNIALTIVWVIGLVNAFNLMDNMDGACATVAGMSATGVAAVGALYGDIALAVIGVSVAGACLGFLRYNLAKPARIFLGDGGSMPIGLIIAGAVMAAPGTQVSGWSAILALAPMVGLPILDTTLVVISRRRGRRPLLEGARDHLTHRMRTAFGGSTRLVALFLAMAQGLLCLIALGLASIGSVLVAAAAVLYVGGLGVAIWALETERVPQLTFESANTLPATSVTPENSAA